VEKLLIAPEQKGVGFTPPPPPPPRIKDLTFYCYDRTYITIQIYM
jgi:hypothetical protein